MSSDLSTGKGHTDENFPVASFLIAKRHRQAVMDFYAVARMADDIADHAQAAPSDKLTRLEAIQASLLGESDAVSAAVRLRETMGVRGLSNQHILELLEAFRRDVHKTRYADWGELMEYCRYSAAPVGRYVLDVHGERQATWPASDALCAALQVINHLQDCGKDFRQLDRIYVPLDALSAAGVEDAALGCPRASAELRAVISDLAGRAVALLKAAKPLAGQVTDVRLSLEIGVIHGLAVDLAARLVRVDPLCERVHHRPIEVLGAASLGASAVLLSRLRARQSSKPAP